MTGRKEKIQGAKKEEILFIENRASWDSGWSMKAKSSLLFTTGTDAFLCATPGEKRTWKWS